jgi:hypothetical protein
VLLIPITSELLRAHQARVAAARPPAPQGRSASGPMADGQTIGKESLAAATQKYEILNRDRHYARRLAGSNRSVRLQ